MIEHAVPHTRERQRGEWVLVPVRSCPWCGGTNEPLSRGAGRCNNSWHRSHPEHSRFWTYPEAKGEPVGLTEKATEWMLLRGQEFVSEVDRLWPEENDPGYRAQCLAEEAGEVSRAITKRRHAMHSPDGLCKGKTVNEWTAEVRMELAQLIGVALDIGFREGFNMAAAVEDSLAKLQAREPGA